MGRGARHVLLALALFLGLLVLSSQGYAQETGDISGQVENGTSGEEVSQGLAVTLEVYSAGTVVATMETVADDHGRFSFVQVLEGDSYGYVISTEYEGVYYSYEKDYPLPSEPVKLTVYETTSSSGDIRAIGYTLMFDEAESGGQAMSVYELSSLENSGDRTFAPDISGSGAMDFLRFSLLASAEGLSVQSDLQGGQLISVGQGFAIIAPVPPGSHEVDYSYTVPFDSRETTFVHSFPFGAGFFRVIFRESLGEIRSTGMKELSPLVFDGVTYRYMEALDLSPEDRVTLEFSGLAQPSLWQGWLDTMPGGDMAKNAVPWAFGAALVVLLGYVLLIRGRSRKRASEAAGTGVQRSGDLEAIARLDDLFQQGGLSGDEYREQRRDLMERFLRRAGPPESP